MCAAPHRIYLAMKDYTHYLFIQYQRHVSQIEFAHEDLMFHLLPYESNNVQLVTLQYNLLLVGR